MFKPSFFKGALAIAACSLIFSACGDDSGSNASADGKDDVVSEKKTSSSSSKKASSSSSKKASSSSSSVIPGSDPESSSSSKKASSSSSKKTSSSSSSVIPGSDPESSSSSKKASSSSSKGEKAESSAAEDKGEELVREDFQISGVSQKGPFVSGTTVIGQELDGKTLKQTGRSFRGKIKNDKGEFDISSVSLVSQYVIVDASGYYLNEVTGTTSKSVITLNALVDLSDRNTVNVNLLTHLEYERVAQLVADGKDVAAAKKQAQKEIFKAFEIEGVKSNSEDLNIFGKSEDNAALLAVSVLMQGDRTEGELTGLLTNFANDLQEDGTWDDDDFKGKIAEWAMKADLGGKLAKIRTNVEGWKLGDVPDFEKHVSNFWMSYYGVGVCDDGNEDEQVEMKGSENVFVCKDGVWKLAKPTASGLDIVSFEEGDDEEKEPTIFDELDKKKIGVGDIWDYTKGTKADLGSSNVYVSWGAYTDNDEDGRSIFVNSKGQYESNLETPYFLSGAGIDADKGVLYGAQFNKGEMKYPPYVATKLIFKDVESGKQIVDMDISSWKGVCIVYASTVPFSILIRDVDLTSYGYYRVAVPASTSTRLLNFAWSEFEQPYGYGDAVPLDDVLQNALDVAFFSQANSGVESGAIYIKAVGKYNGCSTK